MQKNNTTNEVSGTCKQIIYDEMFLLHDGIVLANTIETNMRQEYTFTLK